MAGAGALGLHGALALLLLASLSAPPAYLHAAPDEASMFASLTPAASLQMPALAPPNPMSGLEALSRSLQSADPAIPAGPTHPAGKALLTAMDTAVPLKSTSAPRSQGSSSSAPDALALKDASNPYEHASVAAADATRVEALWAAIRPCWHGGSANGGLSGSAAIRVVLDQTGQVQEMTLLAGRLQDPRSEAAAHAIVACAPYRIGAAGAYLARVPA